jgi:hypothetical protein
MEISNRAGEGSERGWGKTGESWRLISTEEVSLRQTLNQKSSKHKWYLPPDVQPHTPNGFAQSQILIQNCEWFSCASFQILQSWCHTRSGFFWNQREILCTLKRVQKLFCVSKSLNSEPVMHLRGFPELGGAYTMDGVTNWLQLLRQSFFSIASNADAILCIRNDKLAWCSQSSRHMCCSGRLLQRWLQLALCLHRQPSLQECKHKLFMSWI